MRRTAPTSPTPSVHSALGLVAALVTFGVASPVSAQFAPPPDAGGAVVVQGYQEPYPDAEPSCREGYGPECGRPHRGWPASTFRVLTGPAVRLANQPPEGGLFVALEVGRRAAGGRVTATWAGVGQDHGLAQYVGELCLDFGHEWQLHPVLGAGGGVAQLDVRGLDGALDTGTLGIAVLRGGVHYSLPLRGSDARAGVEVLGAVPAVHDSATRGVDPWLIALAAVTVGF